MRELLVQVGLWPVDDPRDPSRSLEAAWQVVEKLQINEWCIDVYGLNSRGEWSVSMYALGQPLGGLPVVMVSASTAPLAICLAALKAIKGASKY